LASPDAGVVLVHREQRAIPDGGGAACTHVSRGHRCGERREPSETTPRQRGIDISANRTKHLDEFVPQRFDTVITLCDRVRQVCPEFPSHPELVHWSIPDPALEGPTNVASYPAFERTAAELETRISFRLHLLTDTATTRRSTHAQR
jgi:protein-tyrosine-phosphatase